MVLTLVYTVASHTCIVVSKLNRLNLTFFFFHLKFVFLLLLYISGILGLTSLDLFLVKM